jgi:hypothetical protein
MKQQPSRTSVSGMFSWFRRKIKVTQIERAEARGATSINIRAINPWHAVAVSTGKPCCRASVAARTVRYLSSEAPPLPLAGCTQPDACLCKYKHHGDRRVGPRRTTDSDLYKNALSRHVMARLTIQDRRSTKGRRATDGR